VTSLVNGQLDTLRSALFQPQVYTLWERLLVSTGLSTNILFPALCVGLLVGTVAGGLSAMEGVTSFDGSAATGEDSLTLLLRMLSAMISLSCLAVLAYGLALPPKPQGETPKTP